MDEREMQTLADALWVYFEPKIRSMLSNGVSYYRAVVTNKAANGKITVQRPFDDTPIQLKYVHSIGSIAEGDQCTVAVFGDDSNAIIIGDGELTNL